MLSLTPLVENHQEMPQSYKPRSVLRGQINTPILINLRRVVSSFQMMKIEIMVSQSFTIKLNIHIFALFRKWAGSVAIRKRPTSMCIMKMNRARYACTSLCYANVTYNDKWPTPRSASFQIRTWSLSMACLT